jgi:KipI family sensor histidine kinase inhibitor
MMSRLLQINKVKWKISPLGEKVLILQPCEKNPSLGHIHDVTHLIDTSEIAGLSDVIPSYGSIALIFNEPVSKIDPVFKQLHDAVKNFDTSVQKTKTIEVPVCYQLGLDWEEVCEHTKLTKQEAISIHVEQCYTIAMMGFIPGFVYLDGLSSKIHCPRKAKPRIKVPQGSIGIGGNQTGVYSLESPGGWQIIGRTPLNFFQPTKVPPVSVRLGERVLFKAIDENEFNRIKNYSSR